MCIFLCFYLELSKSLDYLCHRKTKTLDKHETGQVRKNAYQSRNGNHECALGQG